MAEAVGLVASIIAIAGLAEVAIKSVKTIKSVAEDLKTVRGDLTRSISSVGFSAENIKIAQETLQNYYKKHKSTDPSEVIALIEKKEASQYLKVESLSLQRQLRQFRRRIQSLLDIRALTIVITFKWRHSLKKQIEQFQNRMQLIQTNLTLILGSVQLELAMKKHDRDEVQIEHLKRTLRKDEKIIRELRKERRIMELRADPGNDTDSTESLLLRENVTLILEVVKNLRKTETVLPPRTYGLSTSRARTATGTASEPPRQLSRVRRPPSLGTAHPILPDATQHGTTDANTPAQEHVDGSSTAASDNEYTSVPTSTSSSRSSEDQSPWTQSSSVGASVGGSGSPANSMLGQHAHPRVESATVQAFRIPGSASKEAVSTQQAPESTSESNFIDVRPLEGILRIASSRNPVKVQGSLERLDGSWKPVVATYEPGQTFNFIADSLVSELDLLSEVEQYTGEGLVVWVESPSGRRIKPTGTIQIRWEWPQTRPGNIMFWVFPYHDQSKLVFGEPWAHRDRHWRRKN